MLMLGTRLVCLDMEGGWIWHQLFNIQFFLPSQQPSIKWGGKKGVGYFCSMSNVKKSQAVIGKENIGQESRPELSIFECSLKIERKKERRETTKNKWQSQIIAHFKFKRKIFTQGGS
jgi:hypothetical protein